MKIRKTSRLKHSYLVQKAEQTSGSLLFKYAQKFAPNFSTSQVTFYKKLNLNTRLRRNFCASVRKFGSVEKSIVVHLLLIADSLRR